MVAGAGAIGAAVAWRLQSAGIPVVQVDPSPIAGNASGVAAGMLAPAFETVLDDLGVDAFPMLRAARDEWPAFIAGLEPFGAWIDRSGALWVDDAPSQDRMLERLRAAGADAVQLGGGEVERLCPGLQAPAGAIHCPEDWRLDPVVMLSAMRRAFLAAGGRFVEASLRSMDAGGAILSDGTRLGADAVVLATGLGPMARGEGPLELARLTPIKGQIARSAASVARGGPIVRGPGVYLAPAASGAAVGATMEVGRADLEVDPEVIARFRAAAGSLFPEMAGAALVGAAGVRAATPDGLPMVGASSRPGVILALGARRNGWLLAPMISRKVAEALAGAPAGRFDPLRFED